MPKNSTTATGSLASVVLGYCGNIFNAPMTVGNYVREFNARLDAQRFGEINDGEGVLALHGQNGEECLTRERDWLRSWDHLGLRGMKTLRTVGAETYMTFVRCREEESYERRLTRLASAFLDALVVTDTVTLKVVNLSKVFFDCPFDIL